MWVAYTILSAVLLGFYDVAKKRALRSNDVLWVLLVSCAFTALMLCPWLEKGPASHHLQLVCKAALVTASWIGGLVGMKYLPLTTVSTLKASRPMFVVLFSLLLFGERLNLWQSIGVLVVLLSIFLLSRSSRAEGVRFSHNKGVAAMTVSILAGVASALFDKYIMGHMEPLFVQSWTNIYITALLGIIIGIKYIAQKYCGREYAPRPFKWDWYLPLIAVLITAADFLYFYALSLDGALLSVISLIRRGSVVVVFICGALLFHEHRIKEKAAVLGLMLAGVTLLMVGSM
ncbi:MAG: DMT family transporter [Bacteroidales bacterium]|nr:DMT family transporter [Bacteroidales bacterium]